MNKLNVLAEGYTEQSFAEKMLASYLGHENCRVLSRCITTSKDNRRGRVHRGGVPSYAKVKADLTRWLKECPDGDTRFTTMFDYYALPSDFPGFGESKKIADVYERIRFLEGSFAKDIGDWRFVPYIQLHEFESLIFVAPQELGWTYIENDAAIGNLVEIANEFGCRPELINNGPDTAPSKRILNEIPEYDKVVAGVDTLELIGIDKLKSSCPHFAEWIDKLTSLFPA